MGELQLGWDCGDGGGGGGGLLKTDGSGHAHHHNMLERSRDPRSPPRCSSRSHPVQYEDQCSQNHHHHFGHLYAFSAPHCQWTLIIYIYISNTLPLHQNSDISGVSDIWCGLSKCRQCRGFPFHTPEMLMYGESVFPVTFVLSRAKSYRMDGLESISLTNIILGRTCWQPHEKFKEIDSCTVSHGSAAVNFEPHTCRIISSIPHRPI